MKKAMSLIMASVMALSLLAGCGSKGEEEKEKELTLGTISDSGVYTNDFAGITFTAPGGWSYASEDEIKSMMDAGSEAIYTDNEALLEYAMNSTVYDMVAYSGDGMSNLMVMFENTSRYLGGTSLTNDEYLDELEKNFELVTYFTYQVDGREDVTLGGETYTCLHTSIPDFGMYQDYVVRREGKYMICIAVTAFEENPVNTLADCFS